MQVEDIVDHTGDVRRDVVAMGLRDLGELGGKGGLRHLRRSPGADLGELLMLR